MTQIQPQLRSLYRSLLRELPSRPPTARSSIALLKSPSPIHQTIRKIFSSSESSESQPQALEQLQQGEQFLTYLKAQRMYTTLVERYNPGMGMDETERVRLSARRVGMNMPVEHKPDQ